MTDPGYAWFTHLARTLNSGRARSVILHGGTHDLYQRGDRYVPLPTFLLGRCGVAGVTQLVCELNGPIRIHPPEAADRLKIAWATWRGGGDPDELALQALLDRRASKAIDINGTEFDRLVRDATGSPTASLEFLRQLCQMRRAKDGQGRPIYGDTLLIWIEAADLLVPNGGEDAGRLNAADRHRVGILRDWFGDADFQDAADSVVLLAESRGGVSALVTSLPQVLDISIDPPDESRRRHYLTQHQPKAAEEPASLPEGKAAPQKPSFDIDALAAATAGLGIQALRQLMRLADHEGRPPTPTDVTQAVEAFVAGELGEDVVEFKRPTHTLEDVVGNSKLKQFLRDEVIPRIQSRGEDALGGAAVAGPIGAGKTFVFEAVAGELGLPVLTLKNLRSQWFGQTDVLFEKLRRTLSGLGRVVIFVDEADTAFGGVGAGSHETERRLTGKVQQMMSDPQLRGRVTWLLMTARIHLLSPDIRRPGRSGDLILPVLDPTGDDRMAFVEWMLRGSVDGDLSAIAAELEPELSATSAAAFGSLRSLLKARRRKGSLSVEDVRVVAADYLPPAIEETRRFQTLQALVNTTRRSLLPEGTSAEDRPAWHAELRDLASKGIG